ncbi:sulfite oxidase [Eurytemora carolleeae]|uniref:sulfite oxidase n=1 Tax=Eurytemora carolleeae TaxID=1294199 RepID=UPI000C78694F|nr:sulfite oxidase [Eurytemora carolleeae]|eukprot:XP_023333295.1 sulfite oxidase-like [Eurytemora affinis]
MASSKLLTRFKSDKLSVLSRSLRRPILPALAGYSWDGGRKERGGEGLKWGAAAAGAILGLSGLAYNLRRTRLIAEGAVEAPEQGAGQRRKDLKEFTLEEVAKHDSIENRVWVTYKEGVYDITDFVPLHPGAEKLLMAAGGSVEPFWAMYAVHLNNKVVMELLEEYRIGNLDQDDVEHHRKQMKDSTDPYGNDPARLKVLIVNASTPFNAETPLSILTDSFITPTELFYVRNHLPVPDVDPKNYELEISGLGLKDLTLTLEDLKKFPKHKIITCIQCAGNRRAEMRARKELKGLDWKGGAVGNAEWAGARLSDVLAAAGFNEETNPAVHCIFEGLDHDPAMHPYGASIPIEKASDPRGDVLLAYEMNGEPITRDHGFPVRAIVPGVAGARNVKWLSRVVLSKEESDSHWQQDDYKGFNPSTDWDTVDYKKSEAIQDMPVTSAICSPSPGSQVLPGELEVKGYAWSGGGRRIIRVDLTADGGKTWTQASSLEQDTARHSRHWGWTIWKGVVKVPEGCPNVEVWSKAVDSSYNVQPETFENIWNLRGVLSNAYCRLKLKVNL